ncbi:MAG: hypothetical protein IAE91_08575 [Ignavibacteriaceae bacterium]|nr:hypothetical protein [Ignavibacteriaceae bacterium]
MCIRDRVLGAYIRESILVKKYQPLYNRRLKRNKNLIKLEQYYDENGYINLRINHDNDFNVEKLENLVGVFRSKLELTEKLQEISKINCLCSKLMNLEKTKHACFSYQLGICKGACVQKIPPEQYNLQFENAFKDIRIANWPSNSDIEITEKNGELIESLIFNKWGFIRSSLNDEIFADFKENINFDLDIYKILYGYLKKRGEFASADIG